MSDSIRHECGIAMVRLFKPLRYFADKYGSPLYGFNQLFLLMEKQRNRGQDGAGIGCVKINMPHGESYLFRDRDPTPQALANIFARQTLAYSAKVKSGEIFPEFPETIKTNFDFGGEILLGHLRYTTSGNNDPDATVCHPFARKSIWPTRNLILAGNFNITNAGALNSALAQRGAHPINGTDTQTLLEEIGFWLDEEHTTLYRQLRDSQQLSGEEMAPEISRRLDIAKILRDASKNWDGGYALMGAIGNGDSFILRDPNGIRPCYFFRTPDLLAVASERAALMTIFNAEQNDVQELTPGNALIIKADNSVSEEQILQPRPKKHCSFERIYFSRGNDPEIYAERKALGAALADKVNTIIGGDLEHSVFSFIPNTAETAFFGLIHEFYRRWRTATRDTILVAQKEGCLTEALLNHLLIDTWPRSEKIAHKDSKLRTFISGENARINLASHIYDISYGTVKPDDNLIVIDDSIVRGTTLRESIIRILSRLNPRRIIICSTAPQIRYPDCYGIDMSELGNLLIFNAAIELCKRYHPTLPDEVHQLCLDQENLPPEEMRNHVRAIYEPFSVGQLSDKAAELVRPRDIPWNGEISLVFQSIDNLHRACPTSAGDWYFTGEYPTLGGLAALNRAYLNYRKGKKGRSY